MTTETLADCLIQLRPGRDKEDREIWFLDNDTSYTVRSLYKWLIDKFAESKLNTEQMKIVKKLWKTSAPSKYVVHGWRVLLDKLPTRVALQHRGIVSFNPGPACMVCFRTDEDGEHLFFTCCKSAQLWKKVEEWAGLQDDVFTCSWDHFLQHGTVTRSKKGSKFRFFIWIAAVWNIWINRNRIIFIGYTLNVSHMVDHVKALSWSWFSNRVCGEMQTDFNLQCISPLEYFSMYFFWVKRNWISLNMNKAEPYQQVV